MNRDVCPLWMPWMRSAVESKASLFGMFFENPYLEGRKILLVSLVMLLMTEPTCYLHVDFLGCDPLCRC